MKKNFNEILQREDYVRLTANLKERTEEIAQLIKSKMEQLDLEDEPERPAYSVQLQQ